MCYHLIMMKPARHALLRVLILPGVILAAAQSGFAQADAGSTTAPATQPAVVLGEDVRPLVEGVVGAYRELKSLKLEGTITGQFDVLGRQRTETSRFISAYLAPGVFRHAIEGDVEVGSTGEKLYAYTRRSHAYMTADVPDERPTVDKLPAPLAAVLSFQNPSLTFAVSGDPMLELTENVQSLTRAADVSIGDRPHPTLHLVLAGGDELDLSFDPETNLLRRAVFDLRKSMEKGGAVEVKQATVTIDYTDIDTSAALSAEQFAWSPPLSARDAEQARAAEQEMLAAFQKLEGQPAPDFTLPTLDGKQVALSELRGSVVLLDFWATWCGPCVASMPKLEQTHKDNAATGLKVFAINVGEDQAKVQPFVDEHKLTMPILLDTESAVAGKYGADKAIPFQVLIGRDGVVRKIVVGAGGASQAAMDKAIHENLTQQ